MQTAAVVLISVLGGILFVILIAGIAAMIVLHLRTRKAMAELQTAMTEFVTQSKVASEAQVSGLTALVEGARSSFTGIRADIKTALDTQAKDVAKTLKGHETAFQNTMGKINGDALLRASLEALRAMRELSALSQTLKNLLVDHEAPAAATNLGSEEYGPSDTIYGKQSNAGRLDDVDLESELEEMQPQYSSGMTE